MVLEREKIILIIAFFSGCVVMAMEIAAARLLAPFFGTSVFVWTNIIGVVLAALSIGYYFGGKLSENEPSLRKLLKIIFIAGWLCFLTPFVIRFLSEIILSLFGSFGSSYVFVGSFISAGLLFGLPLGLLGMVSPYLIKLATISDIHTGSVSGKIFAWSTIGSILGTFLPTLVFIPNFGTRATIVIFSGILILLGSFGKRFSVLSLIIIVGMVNLFSGPLKGTQGLIAEKDSTYQYIQVLEGYGGTKYISTNEGLGVQSVYHPDRAETGAYYDFFTLLPYVLHKGQKIDVLIIGLSGGSAARGLRQEFGEQINIDAVEIDEQMTEFARQYFDLDASRVNVFHEDGRQFVKFTDKTYDIIYVDAYQNEFTIPWTLATEEFWESVKEKMKPHGMTVMNINAPSESSKLYEALTNTMAKIFSHTTSFNFGGESLNFLVTGSREDQNFGKLRNARSDYLKKLANRIVPVARNVNFETNKLVLTDDKAPVEFLTETVLYDTLRK